jgi:Ni/Co efflux regulator RcnB
MTTKQRTARMTTLLLAAVLAAPPALAQPPWAGGGEGNGNGKGGGQKHAKQSADEHGQGKGKGGKSQGKGGDDVGKGTNLGIKGLQPGVYFNDRNRQAVQAYYADAGRGGKSCPPGLAKKNNGCLPPGQARKWHVGETLPATVVTYPVPQQILVSLPPVPAGHKYVQVAGDILLVAVGSMMVVDGINGLLSR